MVNDGAPLTVGKNDTIPASVLFPIERFGVPTRISGAPSLLASATRTNVPKFDFGLMEIDRSNSIGFVHYFGFEVDKMGIIGTNC